MYEDLKEIKLNKPLREFGLDSLKRRIAARRIVKQYRAYRKRLAAKNKKPVEVKKEEVKKEPMKGKIRNYIDKRGMTFEES